MPLNSNNSYYYGSAKRKNVPEKLPATTQPQTPSNIMPSSAIPPLVTPPAAPALPTVNSPAAPNVNPPAAPPKVIAPQAAANSMASPSVSPPANQTSVTPSAANPPLMMPISANPQLMMPPTSNTTYMEPSEQMYPQMPQYMPPVQMPQYIQPYMQMPIPPCMQPPYSQDPWSMNQAFMNPIPGEMYGMGEINGMGGMVGIGGVGGMNGTNGIAGMLGMNGMNGMNDMAGTNGFGGMSGMNNMNGTNGFGGMSGVGGMNGMAGMNGIDGAGGMNGMTGMSGIGNSDYSMPAASPGDPPPILSDNPPVVSIVLFKELTGYPNYGNPSGNADILYTGNRGTWTLGLQPFLAVPGQLRARLVIRAVLDDHAHVPVNRYSARITINGNVVHDGPVPLEHGVPVGGRFTNWRELTFNVTNVRRENRVVIVNTSRAGSDDWIGIDSMEMRFTPR